MGKGVISKGIKLSYGTDGNYTELTNLQEIPELGGTSEALEITTLADEAHMYTDGIKSYGEELSFKFLYAKEQFETLNAMTDSTGWKVELPDGLACTFSGKATVKIDGVGINAVVTYTLAIKPDSEMVFA